MNKLEMPTIQYPDITGLIPVGSYIAYVSACQWWKPETRKVDNATRIPLSELDQVQAQKFVVTLVLYDAITGNRVTPIDLRMRDFIPFTADQRALDLGVLFCGAAPGKSFQLNTTKIYGQWVVVEIIHKPQWRQPDKLQSQVIRYRKLTRAQQAVLDSIILN